MTVRDAAVADIVPKMTDLEGYGGFSNPRLIYNLGHAVFEFIESKWGKEGLRQFLFSLRKSVIGGGEDAYEEAFQLKPEEFDQQFEKYLKDRFKPFRDKERPADYGRNLAPNPEKTNYTTVLSIEPSPSGDLIAAMTGNRKDQELDIVLLSAKDGTVVRNLTDGLRPELRASTYIVTPGGRWNTVPWMSWSPKGDALAYFVRTEKERSAHHPERADRQDRAAHPDEDGRRARVAGLRARRPATWPSRRCAARIGDIFIARPRHRARSTNLTNDAFADYGPTFSPGRQVHRLHGARQRQREAVPPRPRHEEEDAAHLRHARRCAGASSWTTTRWSSRRRR